MKNRVRNLVKVNFKLSNFKIRLAIVSFVFLVSILAISIKLLSVSKSYGINFNIWDGIFKTLCYSSFILGVYFPLIVIMVTFFNSKGNYEKYIALRNRRKIEIVISKILSNIIMAFLFTSVFFLILFIVNAFIFRFDSGWNNILLETKNLKDVLTILYINNFVFDLKPVEAFFISYIQIFICSSIILNLKDVLTNYIKKKYISYIVLSFYLISNLIFDAFSFEGSIFEIYKYVGLDTMALLYKHSFEHTSYFPISLSVSFVSSFILLSFIICINLLLNRRLVINHD